MCQLNAEVTIAVKINTVLQHRIIWMLYNNTEHTFSVFFSIQITMWNWSRIFQSRIFLSFIFQSRIFLSCIFRSHISLSCNFESRISLSCIFQSCIFSRPNGCKCKQFKVAEWNIKRNWLRCLSCAGDDDDYHNDNCDSCGGSSGNDSNVRCTGLAGAGRGCADSWYWKRHRRYTNTEQLRTQSQHYWSTAALRDLRS